MHQAVRRPTPSAGGVLPASCGDALPARIAFLTASTAVDGGGGRGALPRGGSGTSPTATTAVPRGESGT